MKFVCEKEGVLTIEDSWFKYSDLYFKRNGKVFRVSEVVKDRPDVWVFWNILNGTVNPAYYFKIAELLELDVDETSYLFLVCMWVEYCSNVSANGMPSGLFESYKPVGLPTSIDIDELLCKADIIYNVKNGW